MAFAAAAIAAGSRTVSMRSRPRRSNATARSAGARAACLPPSRPTKFHLEASRDDIATYTFGGHVIRHHFCKNLRLRAFFRGNRP